VTDLSLTEIQDRILLAGLAHVPFDGWSLRALQEGARDAGYDLSMAERAFPGGPVAAVAHFCRYADCQLEIEAHEAGLETMRVSERINWLIRRRLEGWAQHREAIRRAVSLLSLPSNAALGLQLTWHTVDAMWHAAGDASADFSWYSRRATLGAVYGSTLLFWLEDESEDFAESWAFLARRLKDAVELPRKGKQALEQIKAHLPNPLALLNGGGLLKGRQRFGVRG